jgi:DNA polymerase III alpha subunit
MNARRRPFTLVAILLVGTVTTSACDDEKEAASGTPRSTSVATNRTVLTKANFTSTLVKAHQKAHTNHLELIIEAEGQKVTGSGDQVIAEKFEDNAASMTMDFGSRGPGKMKILVVDGQFYMNFGKPTEGKYAKADLSDTNDALTQQLLSIIDQLDTSKQIEAMSAAVTSLKRKNGSKKIDGVETERYELVVDTSKMSELNGIPAEAKALIPDALTYTLFVGSDGLLRRMTYGFGGMTGTMNLSKWGAPVHITAPSAGDLSDKDLSTLLTGSAA